MNGAGNSASHMELVAITGRSMLEKMVHFPFGQVSKLMEKLTLKLPFLF
jgi:hypothetical protein